MSENHKNVWSAFSYFEHFLGSAVSASISFFAFASIFGVKNCSASFGNILF